MGSNSFKYSDASAEDTLESLLVDVSAFANSCSNISRERMERLFNELVRNPSGENNATEQAFLQCKKPTSAKRNPKYKKNRLFVTMTLILLFLLGLVTVVMLKDIEDTVYRVVRQKISVMNITLSVGPYFFYYTVFKPLRLFGIYMDWTARDELPDCLIPNPLYRSTQPDINSICHCKDIKNILTPKGKDMKASIHNFDRITNLSPQPVIFKDWSQNVSQSDFIEQLSLYGPIMRDASLFSSTLENVTTLIDLADSQTLTDALENSQTHIVWAARNVMRTAVVERWFSLSRGYYYELDEMANLRVLLLDGTDSVPYTFPEEVLKGNGVNVIYVQGWGARKIILMPRTQCEKQCLILVTHVRAGDLLVYDKTVWTARSEPLPGSYSFASMLFV